MMIKKHLSTWLAMGLLASLLTACGGGSVGGGTTIPAPTPTPTPTPTPAPVAKLSVDKTSVTAGWGAVKLDATGTTDATFTWRVKSGPAGHNAQFQSIDPYRSYFLPDLIGTYVVSLTASNAGGSAEATVNVDATLNPLTTAWAIQSAPAAALDLDTQTVVLKWKDTAPAGTVYKAQSLDSTGKATTLTEISGAAAGGSMLQWSGSALGAAGWQVVASGGGFGPPVAIRTILIPLTPGPMSIEFDRTQPISSEDSGNVFLKNNGGYDWVQWTMDGEKIGYLRREDGRADGYVMRVDAPVWTRGMHTVRAQAHLGGYLDLTLSRQVELTRPFISLRVQFVKAVGLGTDYNLVASTSSDDGIRSVEGFIDGRSLGLLTARNWCSSGRFCPQFDQWGYILNLTTGTYALRVVSIDNAGHQREWTQTAVIP